MDLSTVGGENHVNGTGACFEPGARDIVYGFELPGRAKSMVFRAFDDVNFTFIPGLHLFKDGCMAANQIGCIAGNEFTAEALLEVESLEPGNYAIVADGITQNAAGRFNLLVNGVVFNGERCDPMATYMRCELGECTLQGTDYLCQRLYDCPDPIPVDADGDGMIDEDPCDVPGNPPQVTCTTTSAATPGQLIRLQGTAVDDKGIFGKEWEVLERPPGSRAELAGVNQDNSAFRLDLAGNYRFRFRAWDQSYQTAACELTINATPQADLYVEAFWLDDPYEDFDMDIDVIHPLADNWFDFDPETFYCHYDSCGVPPNWGPTGGDARTDNDPIWLGDAPGNETSVEVIYVPAADPPDVYGYGIGVHALTGDPRQLYVNVYCQGVLRTFTATVPEISDFLIEGSFWKVADVRIEPAGCTFTELADVKTLTEAQQAR